MKILVLCYEYPPIGGGGGRVAKAVAEKLSQRSHDLRVQTAGMPHLAKIERVNGVVVYRAQSFRRHEDRCTVAEMALFLATSFLPTLRRLREWRPDVIHAHFAVPTGALAYAVSLLTNVPYVLTVHLGDVPGGFPDQTDHLFRFLKPLTIPIWRRAAGITAVSGHVRDLAMKAYGMPVEKIVNGIELPPANSEPVALHTPRRLLFAGRFVSQKNLILAIEALAQLRDLKWQAMLLGDGPLMPELRKYVQTCGLAERVAMPGWQEAAVVERAMADSDVFLIPSSAEGLPMAAVQALRHGLAIVGTDIGGLHDVIVHERNGFRVPVGDAEALAARVRLLLEDETMLLAMKRASREHARFFDLDAVILQYENLLRAAVENFRRAPSHHGS